MEEVWVWGMREAHAVLGTWGATNLAGGLLQVLFAGLVALVASGHGFCFVAVLEIACSRALL